MKKSTLFSLIFLLWCSSALAISEQIILEKDLTYDGVAEKIIYEVSTADWQQPVDWSLTIYDGSDVLFQHRVEAEDFSYFGEAGMVDDCSGFSDCKEQWYLSKAVTSVLQPIAVAEPRRQNLLDLFGSHGVESYKKQLALSDKNAKKSVAAFVRFLSDKTIECINLPLSPVAASALLSYDIFHKRFITFYQP